LLLVLLLLLSMSAGALAIWQSGQQQVWLPCQNNFKTLETPKVELPPSSP
jgi:hypothetical protein